MMQSGVEFDAYYAKVVALKRDHFWLANRLVEPPNGYFDIVDQLASALERTIDWAELCLLPTFVINTDQDNLLVFYQLPKQLDAKAEAFMQAIDVAADTAATRCAVCGDRLADASKQSKRCKKHLGLEYAVPRLEQRQSLAAAGLAPRYSEEEEGAHFAEGTEDAQTHSGALAARTLPVIDFLDWSTVETYLDKYRPKNDDRYRKAQVISERLRQAGGTKRKLGVLPDHWLEQLDEFEALFPNFWALAEHLRDQFSLNALGDGRINWPPVVLLGPPGIGKTEASAWLAERWGLPLKIIDMATAQTNFALSGSESYWGNSEPGQVFETLGYQTLANPIFLLDEIDKAATGYKDVSPLSTLLGLLESRTARRFRDLSIDHVEFDASHINWIATANDLANFPAPLRSRFNVIEVPEPSRDERRRIAQGMYQGLREEGLWGKHFSTHLPDAVIEQLADMVPRQMKRALIKACGVAARQQRFELLPADIPKEGSAHSLSRVGFV